MILNNLLVDADEMKRLGKRFRKLDTDSSGTLSKDEIMSMPELQTNPIVTRVIDIFDTNGNGEIDFKEFIQGLSQFSVKGDITSKLHFAFRFYDMDNDGFISSEDLFQVSSIYFFNLIFVRISMMRKISLIISRSIFAVASSSLRRSNHPHNFQNLVRTQYGVYFGKSWKSALFDMVKVNIEEDSKRAIPS